MDDNYRFQEFIKTFPEVMVDSLVKNLCVEIYTVDIFNALKNYELGTLPNFENKKIKKTYNNFSKTLKKTKAFLDKYMQSFFTEQGISLPKDYIISGEEEYIYWSLSPNTKDGENLHDTCIKLLPAFVRHVEEDYKKVKTAIENELNKEPKFWIDFKGRRAVLSNKYIINEMQFGRYTEDWFQYISDNPNREISLEELREKTRSKSERSKDSLHKFLNQINFKGQLGKMFFDCGKNILKFYNPITQVDLKNRMINIQKLEREIEALPTAD